jgi:hypothetical protein
MSCVSTQSNLSTDSESKRNLQCPNQIPDSLQRVSCSKSFQLQLREVSFLVFVVGSGRLDLELNFQLFDWPENRKQLEI